MTRAPIKQLPALEMLHELFLYDADTGLLGWKLKTDGSRSATGFNNRTAGKPVGTLTTRGYLTVGIRMDGKSRYYLTHRIIWKMMTGDEPIDQIDHIDGNRLNNKWNNLRAATNGQNLRNSKLRADNKSGVKGVCWDVGHKKWLAAISMDKRQVKIGRFASIEEAKTAIENARAKLHCEFARYL